MPKPTAEIIEEISTVNSCEIGRVRDALKQHIEVLEDANDAAPTEVLWCILVALTASMKKVEHLCSEGSIYLVPKEPDA